MKKRKTALQRTRFLNKVKDESGVGVVEVILILVDIFVLQNYRKRGI